MTRDYYDEKLEPKTVTLYLVLNGDVRKRFLADYPFMHGSTCVLYYNIVWGVPDTIVWKDCTYFMRDKLAEDYGLHLLKGGDGEEYWGN